MTITTVSSCEFNPDTSTAKKAIRQGPVFITDRGKPALVHGLIVVTRNVSDFTSSGVAVINPWDA